jgi:hypothetical protein
VKFRPVEVEQHQDFASKIKHIAPNQR